MQKIIIDKRLKNISWNLISGLISGILIVVSTSFMVKNLGYDKYGIISIWVMLQGLIQIFDYGVGAAVSRVINKKDTESKTLLNASSKFYKGNAIGVATISSLIVLYRYRENIDVAVVHVLMILALSLQFRSIFYSCILSGKAEHENLSKSQIIGNILRYGGALLVVTMTDKLVIFFAYQIMASAATLLLFKQFCKKYLNDDESVDFKKAFIAIKGIASHSLGMWLTSGVSVALASSDRALIGLLGGDVEVGKYSTALVAAGLMSLVTLPYYRVFYTEYSSSHFNDPSKLKQIFNDSCAQLALILTVIGIVAYLNSELIFRLWLGNYEPMQVRVFSLLIIGMGLSSVMWLPGALCQAVGRPLVHIWMMGVALVLGVVVAIPCIARWGYVGASAIWLIHGVIGILLEMLVIKYYVIDIDLLVWYRKVFTMPLVLIFSVLVISYYNAN